MTNIHYKETQTGFEFGNAKISRFTSHGCGAVTLGLETDKYKGGRAIQIYVTKTGKVRVFSDGEWIKPDKKLEGVSGE